MPRIVKDPDVRRNEILDAAQQLFVRKGYDQTSVQHVIAAAGISKGAFYHYFGSKVELLDDLTARMTTQTLAAVRPILDDDRLDAHAKMEAFFGFILQWKAANRRYLIDLMRVVYRDENALYRYKMTAAGLARIAPLVGEMIRQGVAQGVFDTEYPAEMGEVVMTILRSVSESLALMLLEETPSAGDLDDRAARMEQAIRVHEFAVARILRPARPLRLLDVEQAKLFLVEPEPDLESQT